MYHLVRHALGPVSAGRHQSLGPHALRHACARRLLESGHSLKAVGDHLGHRDPDTTRVYAKVNLVMLRLVALEDLGGLV
jgi:site-specific recombinase XerD